MYISAMCHLVSKLLCALLLLSGLARAVTLQEANALYKSGEYAKSAAACEDLIRTGGNTASRLYTLGNARFQLKEYGPAILAFERAALLAPRDADIQANLKMTRKAAAALEEPVPLSWWETPLHAFSLREWSLVAIGSAFLPALAALAWGLGGFSRAWIKRSALTLLVVGILTGAVAGSALWYRKEEKTLGIITAGVPVLHVSPFPGAAPVGTPPAGQRVFMGERVPGWVYVTLPNSSTRGWLPDEEVSLIMMDTP